MFRSLPIVVIFLLLIAPVQAQQATDERIQALSEQVMHGSEVTIAGASLAAHGIIPDFYARRQFAPAWSNTARVDELIDLVGRAYEEGLDPSDYLYEELVALRDRTRAVGDDADTLADLDVLLTESLSRYGYHLIFGKVDPADLDDNWNWTRSADGRDPAALIQQAIDSTSIEKFIADYLDRGPIYDEVREMLAEHRVLQAQGGWPQVSDGPTLRRGVEDDRIAAIRSRLAVSGDLPPAADNGSGLFDEALEEGVMRFQHRHNLDADGAIGAQTIAAMNVTVEERIDQIRVNLERLRWIIRDLDDEFVLTNIAAFQTVLVKDMEIIWSARSQVGRFYRQTPVFRDEIEYMQFNPTWTVPPGILTNDILPAVQKDIGYLAQKNMDLVARDGSIVDPATVDWSAYGPGRLPPFQFVQRPGPTNALGRVKFIFPNPHFVFLHDTPSKSLFDRAERAFSSGCIRVEQPFEFAELLLDNPNKWNQPSIQAVLDSAEPKTVFLGEPMTVMLIYATVGLIDAAEHRFYNDIYERDAKVLASLDDEFVFKLPEDSPAHSSR